MKKILPFLIPLTFFAVILLHGGDAGIEKNTSVKFQEGELSPTILQQKVERLVFDILSNYHYRKVPVNDSLSEKILEEYIKNLDPNKAYFLASDISNFDQFKYKIDDDLARGELSSAFVIYNTYQKRVKERFSYVKSLLNSSQDFALDESYAPNRDKLPWANDVNSLNDYWRKDLKRQILDEKINSKKADTTIIRELKDRFNRSEKYLTRAKSEDVFQIFMNAYTESIDPHTSYMIPKTASEFNKDMSQSFEGIGATLRLEGDYVTIMELIPGGPAFRSKQISPKDRIVGVAQGDDGAFTDIIGWFTDDAVKLIRGAKGTVVRLKVLKGNAAMGTPPVEIRLVREKIKIEEQTAKKEILLAKNGEHVTKIGLITIPMFYRDFEGARSREKDFKSTSADVKKFLNEFKNDGGVDAVVIDLRNNGGGSLIEAIELTGLFITKGPVVQRKSSEGRISTEVDDNPELVYDGPLAVMINRFSASASEIFAAAIQDYKRGVVVGEQSYGKGTVQSVVDLTRYMGETEPAGSLKITLEKFYRINGSSTQHKGVSPDFALPSAFTAEEYGESAQKSALPWDMIASSAYQPVNAIPSSIQSKLLVNFQNRMKTNTELLKLKSDTEKFKKYKEKNLVSLQIEKRKQELEELKKQPDETESIVQAMGGNVVEDPAKAEKDKKDKHEKDVYLKETKQIVLDWLSLIKPKSAKVVLKK